MTALNGGMLEPHRRMWEDRLDESADDSLTPLHPNHVAVDFSMLAG
jgi:hypothetical protein